MTIDMYSPRTMGSAVHQMLPVRTFLRDLFFGRVETFPTEIVDIDITKGKRKIAPFVHPRIGGKVIERDGYITKTYKPVLVAPKMVTTADQIAKRMAGESLYGGKSPDERSQEILATDLADLDEMITRREEAMVAQCLTTGRLDIKGDGIDEVLDFGFTNKEVLSGDKLWSNQNSDPIGDLNRWVKEVRKASGLNCDTLIMSGDTADVFINHPNVQKSLDLKSIDLGLIRPADLPSGAMYIGRLLKPNVEIYAYDEWYIDPLDEQEKEMIPKGKVVIAPSNFNSTMMYGAVTIMDQKTETFTTYEAERVPDSWVTKDPAQRWVQVNAKPLPIPHNVDGWYVADVL